MLPAPLRRRGEHVGCGLVAPERFVRIETEPGHVLYLGAHRTTTLHNLQTLRDETAGKGQHYVTVKQLSLYNDFIYCAAPLLREYAKRPTAPPFYRSTAARVAPSMI